MQLVLPLSPLEEQKRIVTKVDELMALFDELMQHINRSSELQNLTAATLASEALSESIEKQETKLALAL